MNIEVCEMFSSIQGESTWAGRPCFFIRLSGCNLDCSYCDTPYARGGGRIMPASEAAAAARASGLKMAEVTGGEPLLQAGAIELLGMLSFCDAVLVETNGSLDISPLPKRAVAIMDIKCPSSGQSHTVLWSNLERLRPHDEVKFVLCGRADYEWARETVARRGIAGRCRAVLFSPAAGRLDPADLAAWIIEDRLDVRLNVQLHAILWPGKRRGV